MAKVIKYTFDLGNGLEGRMKKPSDDITKTSLPGPFVVNNVSGRPQVYPAYGNVWEDTRFENNKLEIIWDCGPTDYIWETIDEIRKRIQREWANSVSQNNEVLSHQMELRLQRTAAAIRDKYPVGG